MSAPFRADQVGSFLRPPRRKETHATWLQGTLRLEALPRLEDEASFVARLASGPYNMTMPAPSYILARGYRADVTDPVYGTRSAALHEVASIVRYEVDGQRRKLELVVDTARTAWARLQSSALMPKIDWRDDDQPRWERLRHLRRIYQPRTSGPAASFTVPIVRAPRSAEPNVPVRKPLHLIWGEPAQRQDGPSRSEPSP